MHSTPGQSKPFTFDIWEMEMMSFPYHTGLWNFVVKIMLKPLVDEEMKQPCYASAGEKDL